MKPLNRFYAVVHFIARIICKIIFPYSVEGLENLPNERVLLCPNHSNNLDPLLIAVSLPRNYRLHFMGKEELFKNPVLNYLFRKVGGFPVSRGNSDIKSVRTAIEILKSGDNLLIFPEGTVVYDGIGYIDGLPAHARGGVAMIGVRTGATMVPVFTGGNKKLFHHTRIIFGKPYTPAYTGRHGTAEEMQKIADDILREAYALGGQAVGGKPL